MVVSWWVIPFNLHIWYVTRMDARQIICSVGKKSSRFIQRTKNKNCLYPDNFSPCISLSVFSIFKDWDRFSLNRYSFGMDIRMTLQDVCEWTLRRDIFCRKIVFFCIMHAHSKVLMMIALIRMIMISFLHKFLILDF